MGREALRCVKEAIRIGATDLDLGGRHARVELRAHASLLLVLTQAALEGLQLFRLLAGGVVDIVLDRGETRNQLALTLEGIERRLGAAHHGLHASGHILALVQEVGGLPTHHVVAVHVRAEGLALLFGLLQQRLRVRLLVRIEGQHLLHELGDGLLVVRALIGFVLLLRLHREVHRARDGHQHAGHNPAVREPLVLLLAQLFHFALHVWITSGARSSLGRGSSSRGSSNLGSCRLGRRRFRSRRFGSSCCRRRCRRRSRRGRLLGGRFACLRSAALGQQFLLHRHRAVARVRLVLAHRLGGVWCESEGLWGLEGD